MISYYEDKRVVVTGGLGFIGSHLVNSLVARGAQVYVVDSHTYAADLDNISVKTISLNISNVQSEETTYMLRLYDPHIIFHLAAETHVDNSIEGGLEFVATDTYGTANLLECCRELESLTRFVFMSTDEVYGSVEGPTTEIAPFAPGNPYSASKAGADLLVQAYYKTHGLPVAIVRPCNTYGSRQHPEKFIPKFICNGIMGEKMPLYGGGGQSRQWLHVDDCVSALCHVGMIFPSGEAYNVTSDVSHTNWTVADMICRALGVETNDYIESVEDRLGHDSQYWLDGSKIRDTGWSPLHMYDFSEKLKETVNWYIQNFDWWKEKLND